MCKANIPSFLVDIYLVACRCNQRSGYKFEIFNTRVVVFVITKSCIAKGKQGNMNPAL